MNARDVHEDFASETFLRIMKSSEMSKLSRERREYLAEKVLPILFDALPELLRQQEQHDIENRTFHPLRWLGQYLYRHNPEHLRQIPCADTAANGHTRVASLLKRIAANSKK